MRKSHSLFLCSFADICVQYFLLRAKRLFIVITAIKHTCVRDPRLKADGSTFTASKKGLQVRRMYVFTYLMRLGCDKESIMLISRFTIFCVLASNLLLSIIFTATRSVNYKKKDFSRLIESTENMYVISNPLSTFSYHRRHAGS